MTKDMLLLLGRELRILDDAARVLETSYEKCSRIGATGDYDDDELDRFEALTSRFARLSDIVIQKMFRLIDEMDLDSAGTVRDRINRAEKKGLIEDADVFVEIRTLRNSIAHEYLPEAVREMFPKVLSLTPSLLSCVHSIHAYCSKYGSARDREF